MSIVLPLAGPAALGAILLGSIGGNMRRDAIETNGVSLSQTMHIHRTIQTRRAHFWALSQITENRKVETRKSLIF